MGDPQLQLKLLQLRAQMQQKQGAQPQLNDPLLQQQLHQLRAQVQQGSKQQGLPQSPLNDPQLQQRLHQLRAQMERESEQRAQLLQLQKQQVTIFKNFMGQFIHLYFVGYY